MTNIITITGVEENLGVTSIAIGIAKKFADKFKNKKILLVDMNLKNHELYTILSSDNKEQSLYGLNNVMDYAIGNYDLTNVINYNTEKLDNCTLDILLNTGDFQYTENQYKELFKSLDTYDIVVFDTNIESLNTAIINNSTIIYMVVTDKLSAYRTIEKSSALVRNCKTQIIFNMFCGYKYDSKKILDKTISHYIRMDKNVSKVINSGNINFVEGDFDSDIEKISYELCNNFNYKIKKSLFRKIKEF